MRAFLVAAKAAISFYNDLFLLLGLNLIWWATGGIFLAAAAVLAVLLYLTGPGTWWMAPIVAIPAGPAMAAMAVVARRSARDIRVDRGYYVEGLREFWRPAVRISATGMIATTLLLLNVLFYTGQENQVLRLLTFLWAYLAIVSIAIQMYAYPILVALEKPRALVALRTAALAAFANPLFSALLLVVADGVTLVSVLIVPLVFLAWPAFVALLSEHALRLFLERAGVNPDKGTSAA